MEPAELTELRGSAMRAGFNLVGVLDVTEFDARAPAGFRVRDALPDAASAIVIGSGGPYFWQVFKQRPTSADPEDLDRAAGSIDAYSTVVIPKLAERLRGRGAKSAVVYPFGRERPIVSFRRLAEAAGFGAADTVLGLVIHPVFGPGVSVRGAIVTDFELAPSPRFDGYQPCEDCPRPCVAACPIGSYAGEEWDFHSCQRHRRDEGGCPAGCWSRLACVVGRDRQYSAEEYAYRHSFRPGSAFVPTGLPWR